MVLLVFPTDIKRMVPSVRGKIFEKDFYPQRFPVSMKIYYWGKPKNLLLLRKHVALSYAIRFFIFLKAANVWDTAPTVAKANGSKAQFIY